mgnify:CR=1 FL=1|jgi:hypothetical protein
MVRGNDDSSDAEDGRVLSPEELDITNDEHVAEIDDGRYVVSPNDPIGDVPTADTTSTDDRGSRSRESGTEPDSSPEPGQTGQQELSSESVHEFLEAEFEGASSRYGFDVTGKFDGSVHQRRMVSNDVVTIFESLVLWYAQQIDSTTPVEEVLGILLMEANVPVRYPAASLQRLVQTTDLSPDDSIAELVEAVGDEDGFRI